MKKLLIALSFVLVVVFLPNFVGATETCVSCEPPKSDICVPEGKIETDYPSCVIGVGESTCGVKVSWMSWNGADMPSYVYMMGPNNVSQHGGIGEKNFQVHHGTSKFRLVFHSQDTPTRHHTVDVSTAYVTATCAPGSTWDRSVCAPNNVVVASCPAGYTGTSPNCVPPVTVCPANMYLSNGICVPVVIVNNNQCVIERFIVDQTSVNAGSPVVIRWHTNGCNLVSISGLGNVAPNGSQTVYPNASMSYTLNASGNNSYQTQSVYVNVQNIIFNQPIVNQVIEQVQAPVRIVRQVVSSSVRNVKTSTTASYANIVGTASPIMLSIVDKYQAVGKGDIVEYTVTYKNIGNTTLSKPLLQIVVPEGVIMTNVSSGGSYQQKDNTLSVPLGDLLPNQEGVVYAQGRVSDMFISNSKIVTKAIIIYTTVNGTQETAMAYVANDSRDLVSSSNLGASAFFGNFGNLGLIGWLVLIILILIIVLIVRSVTKPRVVYTPSVNHHNDSH